MLASSQPGRTVATHQVQLIILLDYKLRGQTARESGVVVVVALFPQNGVSLR